MKHSFLMTYLRDRKGIALLLVVSVISLLIALTVQFSNDMQQELSRSVSIRDTAKLNDAAMSGYNIGDAVLTEDREDNSYDTVLDPWYTLKNSALTQFYSSLQLGVAISDLSGRIQLNVLGGTGTSAKRMKKVLRKVLLSGDLGDIDEDNADLIIAAIGDWVDSNDESRSDYGNTESSYYESLKHPYGCRNDDMEHVEELLHIRGITSSLYYGTSSHLGLRDVVTVYGDDGKININTAPKAVLKALTSDDTDEVSDELAAKMVAYRKNSSNEASLSSKTWYKNVSGWSSDVTLQSKLITVSSSYFRIHSRVEMEGLVKDMISIVERESSGELELISRKVE